MAPDEGYGLWEELVRQFRHAFPSHGCSLDPSALCAVATGLARRATEQNFAAIAGYANRLAREYGTLLIKSATARLPDLAHHPAFTRWAVANGAALA